MTEFTDDFNGGGDLGPNWVQSYGGSGTIAALPDAGNARWQPMVHSDKVNIRFHEWPTQQLIVRAGPGGPGAVMRMEAPLDTALTDEQQYAGAILNSDTACRYCHKTIAEGDVLIAQLRVPAQDGFWHHTDCADPKLEHVEVDD